MSTDNPNPMIPNGITEIGGRKISNFATSGISVGFESTKQELENELTKMQIDAIKKGIRFTRTRTDGPIQR